MQIAKTIKEMLNEFLYFFPVGKDQRSKLRIFKAERITDNLKILKTTSKQGKENQNSKYIKKILIQKIHLQIQVAIVIQG